MAPTTRNGSAASTGKKDGRGSQTKKERRGKPTPPKSALRRQVKGHSTSRTVSFEAEDEDDTVRFHFPATPHPTPTTGRLPSPNRSAPYSPIDHSKRKEREQLLLRAAKVLGQVGDVTAELSTPPSSPEIVPISSSDKPEEKSIEEHPAQTPKARIPKPFNPKNFDGCDVNSTHFDPAPVYEEIEISKLTSTHADIVQDQIPESPSFPKSIDEILCNPNADIELEEVCTAFDVLKSQIQQHCRMYYGQAGRYGDIPVPTFTQLAARHPELFRYIQYVADGSQYGWKKLLSLPTQCENLAYGILSRALVAYVFDAELFGAAPEHEEELLEMCREYLNFDAFVRNTHRASIIKRILCDNYLSGIDHSYFQPAIHSLASRLARLVVPLQRFSTGISRNSFYTKELTPLIMTALKIHLAIRLYGRNGTVFRFENATKLTHWDGLTMNCVNQLRVDLTTDHGDECLVKLSCFPAVYATIPTGPTLESFTDPAFVEQWKESTPLDPHTGEAVKPLITTYPITLADVVLENTPSYPYDDDDDENDDGNSSHNSFSSRPTKPQTLSQTLVAEQSAMSDTTFMNLTAINRARNRRIARLVRRIRPILKGVTVLSFSAALIYYIRRHRVELEGLLRDVHARGTRVLHGLRQMLFNAAIGGRGKGR